MNRQMTEQWRKRLDDMAARIEGTATSLEEEARTGTGGTDGGNLSNSPMHLGDLGTEVYLLELNATLLENEVYLQDEIRDALRRMDDGTFGVCERCGKEIPEGRLDALPYARHCAPCSEKEHSGLDVNFNAGRGDGPAGRINPADPNPGDDSHAAGTPGGGTAVGGLAGTNVGRGDPTGDDLEGAMGSGQFDRGVEADDEDGYAGASGGAVGGTPAGKRASGGKTGGGMRPGHDRGDSATGQ